jgi:hypothetical protein
MTSSSQKKRRNVFNSNNKRRIFYETDKSFFFKLKQQEENNFSRFLLEFLLQIHEGRRKCIARKISSLNATYEEEENSRIFPLLLVNPLLSSRR